MQEGAEALPTWAQLQAPLDGARAAQGSGQQGQAELLGSSRPGLNEEHVCTCWDFCLLQSSGSLLEKSGMDGQHNISKMTPFSEGPCPISTVGEVIGSNDRTSGNQRGLKPLTSMF